MSKRSELAVNWKMNIISFIAALFAGIFIKDILGAHYEFVPDNDDFFEDCPKQANVIGMNEAFNLTEMTFAYDEGRVTISGNLTFIWKDIAPTDHIMVLSEGYKFQHGDWQPTVLSLRIEDFCQNFLDNTSTTYQLLTSNIVEEDHICLLNYGQVYHFETSEVNTTFQFPVNMEGRHKIITIAEVYDEDNEKRETTLCVEVPGAFYKL